MVGWVGVWVGGAWDDRGKRTLKDGLRQVKGEALVERAEQKLGVAHVRPVAVDEHEPLKEPELCDGVVACARRLQPFLWPEAAASYQDPDPRGCGPGGSRGRTYAAGDADADVGGLDHGNVVGAVADGQGHLAQPMPVSSGGEAGFVRYDRSGSGEVRRHRPYPALLIALSRAAN